MALFQTDSLALCYLNIEAATQWWIATFDCRRTGVRRPLLGNAIGQACVAGGFARRFRLPEGRLLIGLRMLSCPTRRLSSLIWTRSSGPTASYGRGSD